mgnify:CR=1 FL=1
MSDKDLKLLKLRNEIFEDFIIAYEIIYDELMLQDMCYLTENVIYQNDKDSDNYALVFKIFIDDVIKSVGQDIDQFNCVDANDFKDFISEELEVILDEYFK